MGMDIQTFVTNRTNVKGNRLKCSYLDFCRINKNLFGIYSELEKNPDYQNYQIYATVYVFLCFVLEHPVASMFKYHNIWT